MKIKVIHLDNAQSGYLKTLRADVAQCRAAVRKAQDKVQEEIFSYPYEAGIQPADTKRVDIDDSGEYVVVSMYEPNESRPKAK